MALNSICDAVMYTESVLQPLLIKSSISLRFTMLALCMWTVTFALMVSVPNEALKNKQHEHLFIILRLWGQGLTMPFSTLKYYLTEYLSEKFLKSSKWLFSIQHNHVRFWGCKNHRQFIPSQVYNIKMKINNINTIAVPKNERQCILYTI